MSLRSFHVVFVVAAIAIAVMFGVWGVADWRQSGSVANLAMAIGSLIFGGALIAYLPHFFRTVPAES